jgi:hypothetical protein
MNITRFTVSKQPAVFLCYDHRHSLLCVGKSRTPHAAVEKFRRSEGGLEVQYYDIELFKTAAEASQRVSVLISALRPRHNDISLYKNAPMPDVVYHGDRTKTVCRVRNPKGGIIELDRPFRINVFANSESIWDEYLKRL